MFYEEGEYDATNFADFASENLVWHTEESSFRHFCFGVIQMQVQIFTRLPINAGLFVYKLGSSTYLNLNVTLELRKEQ